MTELGDLAERLQGVRQQIADAGGPSVEILGVTKGHPVEVVQSAIAAGLVAIGENYAQELIAKLQDAPFDVAVHFIGQLQTNKVRHIVDLVDVYETVDRPGLVAELAKRAPGAHVLVQVDTTGQASKGGCHPAEVESLVTNAADAGLVVDGLMTVGPTTGGPEAARPGFHLVRGMCDQLGLATCSMGMSDDFIIAVQEGSTRVRLGSVLFGMRPVAGSRVR
ncbi:MAG: YggS family pyridoxal phosphate-dependent enzyme [Ilumatobacteraceae bacterium]